MARGRRPLPQYRTPYGESVATPLAPPFTFEGMTARVFPLRARIDSLRQFCDRYLNDILPEEIGHFRPAAPYVYLLFVNYGRMEAEVENVGWLAQREIVFNVPLQWYRRVNGRLVFHDWATIAPFIFVDSDTSATVGRNVYGWPKAVAKLRATQSAWIEDPVAPITEATVSTKVFPELYRARKLEDRDFLVIDRDAPISNFRYPPDPHSPAAPWIIASHLAESFVGAARDYFGLLDGLGLLPRHRVSDPGNYTAMIGRAAEWIYQLGRDCAANTLNLKQFRSSQHPRDCCFQALTNGPMRFTALNRLGLLGEQQVFLGDSSGGFSIKLYRWPSLPILETLGLEPFRTYDTEGRARAAERVDRAGSRGPELVQLKPVLPFWFDANVEYLPGYDLARRSQNSRWEAEDGRRFRPKVRGGKLDRRVRRFNTTLGAFNKALVGPYRFTGTTVRVLPLLAKRERLGTLLDEYLNEPLASSHQRFEVWAPEDSEFAYVYLTATVYGDVTSRTNNVGDWADGEVAFLVPVLRYLRDDAESDWELCSAGLVPAAAFVDSATAAAAGSEVLGLPMVQAEFERPTSAWMTDVPPGSEGRQVLLRVITDVLPAIGEGQRSERRNVLTITAEELTGVSGETHVPMEADRWVDSLERERMRKAKAAEDDGFEIARALSLELLVNRVPLCYYTIKQIRDVARPDEAVYQSLVGIHRHLDRVEDIREIETPLFLEIQDPPAMPIVETLGLVAYSAAGDGLGAAYRLHPVRPFWLRLAVEEKLGQRLSFRSGRGPWDPSIARIRRSDVGSYFCKRDTAGVGTQVLGFLDFGNPTRLADAVKNWNDGNGPADGGIPMAEARDAVAKIDPQTVIESILSREWGSLKSRWAAEKEKRQEELRKELEGVDWGKRAKVEAAYFDSLLESLETQRDNKHFQEASDRRDHMLEMDRHLHYFEQCYSKLKQIRAGGREGDEIPGSLRRLLDEMEWFTEEAAVRGHPSSSVLESKNRSRLRELLRDLKKLSRELEEPAPEAPAAEGAEPPFTPLRLLNRFWPALEMAEERVRERVELQRDALLNWFARTAQKPHHGVYRGWAGEFSPELFPEGHAFNNDFYEGEYRRKSDEEERGRPDQ